MPQHTITDAVRDSISMPEIPPVSSLSLAMSSANSAEMVMKPLVPVSQNVTFASVSESSMKPIFPTTTSTSINTQTVTAMDILSPVLTNLGLTVTMLSLILRHLSLFQVFLLRQALHGQVIVRCRRPYELTSG